MGGCGSVGGLALLYGSRIEGKRTKRKQKKGNPIRKVCIVGLRVDQV